jgi:hypothetical protein
MKVNDAPSFPSVQGPYGHHGSRPLLPSPHARLLCGGANAGGLVFCTGSFRIGRFATRYGLATRRP